MVNTLARSMGLRARAGAGRADGKAGSGVGEADVVSLRPEKRRQAALPPGIGLEEEEPGAVSTAAGMQATLDVLADLDNGQ